MTEASDLATAVGRLVAVNVGLPADVQWRGRTVHVGVEAADIHTEMFGAGPA